MIEIVNKKPFSVQLMVRSGERPNSFTTLNIPGIGAGHNTYYLEDERMTDCINRFEKWGYITTKRIPNSLRKGE